MQVVATYFRNAAVATLYTGRIIRQRVQEAGIIIKENLNTLWVQLEDGHIIKRHRFKHGVICMSEQLMKLLKKEPINDKTIVQL